MKILYCLLLLFSSNAFSCGIALVCLRKPLSYYQEKYGDYGWGTRKVCALIEEQRNRGQDGAGIVVMQEEEIEGKACFHRLRYAGVYAVDILVQDVLCSLSSLPSCLAKSSAHKVQQHCSFVGKMYLGHVRYATYAGNNVRYCQPYVYKDSNDALSFALAGNFNLTNTQQLYEQLLSYGIKPTCMSDTQMVLESLRYFLEQEHALLKQQVKTDNMGHTIDIVSLIRKAAQLWDGGYVFAGILNTGKAFVCRDPAGIRPAFFYHDEEIIAVASERAALSNVFGVEPLMIESIKPGHALFIHDDGTFNQQPFMEPVALRQCSFERIYFSRCGDPEIYHERKTLGKSLAKDVLKILLNEDLNNVVFTYVPHSSEVAFLGLIEALQELLLHRKIRSEKLIYKNQKHRTFIMQEEKRNHSVTTAYSVTKGIIGSQTTLVVVDDSIVRGTTLRESLIPALIALQPKHIIIVSSAPPILYPDCYGIDMSQLGSFIVFQAAVALLKERHQERILEDIYTACRQQEHLSANQMTNYVQNIYALFAPQELAEKVGELVRPKQRAWKGDITIIYQTIEGLHTAMPDYAGDWYFTGSYPTPGGLKVLNSSYIQWYEGSMARAY